MGCEMHDLFTDRSLDDQTIRNYNRIFSEKDASGLLKAGYISSG